MQLAVTRLVDDADPCADALPRCETGLAAILADRLPATTRDGLV